MLMFLFRKYFHIGNFRINLEKNRKAEANIIVQTLKLIFN